MEGQFLSRWHSLLLSECSRKIFEQKQEIFIKKFQYVTPYHFGLSIGRKIAVLMQVMEGTSYDSLILRNWKLRLAITLTL